MFDSPLSHSQCGVAGWCLGLEFHPEINISPLHGTDRNRKMIFNSNTFVGALQMIINTRVRINICFHSFESETGNIDQCQEECFDLKYKVKRKH